MKAGTVLVYPAEVEINATMSSRSARRSTTSPPGSTYRFGDGPGPDAWSSTRRST